MYLVKRAKRASSDPVGDIIHLDQVRALVELTPHFGEKADRRFDRTNSSSCAIEYWLDNYFDKELFFALRNISGI